MKMIACRFLPDILEGEDSKQLREKAYEYYKNEILESKIIFKNKKIIFFEKPVKDGYMQGFYHIITKKNRKNKMRFYDDERTSKIVWILPIIRNYLCNEECCIERIKVWKSEKRVSIYFQETRFLIILDEKKRVYNFITAFPVTEQYNKSLLKRYQKADERIK